MKTLTIKKLFIISIAAFASAAILIAVMTSIFNTDNSSESGFNTDVPDASTDEMAQTKSDAYRYSTNEEVDTIVKPDTTVNVTIRRTLDDFRKTAETTKIPAENIDQPTPKKTPKAKKTVKKKSEKIGDTMPVVKRRGFIEAKRVENQNQNIEACIHEDQKVKNGDRVRIRITENCRLDGVDVKAGTIVTGTVNISGSRIKIEIRSVKAGREIIDTRLSVFDNDSVEGIFYPEFESEKAARNTGSNLTRQIASALGSSSKFAGTILEGGSQYISEKMENSSVKLYGNYRITLVKI